MKLWTYDTCYEAAKKCSTKNEFRTTYGSAYNVALKNKWLTDYTWFVEIKKPNGYWSYETCYQEAKKYTTKNDFRKMAHRAYSLSLQNDWINEYTWFEGKHKPSGHWTYDACYNEAKKYNIKNEFRKKSSGAYDKARKEGWLTDYTWFIETKKPSGYWTYETCYQEAKKYKTRGEFQKNCKGAYNRARQNGWINDYTWFVDGNEIASKERIKWTYDTCMNEAKKYKKIRDFAKGNSRAYEVARQHGWIDKCHWFKRLPYPKGYWDIFENVKVESEKYKTKQEFYKGCRGAYNSAVKHEWINILFN